MVTLQIPADLTIVTLKDQNQTYPQKYTPQYCKQLLTQASSILETRAQIRFNLGTCTASTEELQPGMRADAVDEAGFMFLTALFRAGAGVRVLFVDKLSDPKLGGRSIEEKKMVILPYDSDAGGAALKLAHEFVHLLGIEPHIDKGPDRVANDPGNEARYSAMRNNLMYSGGLSNEALLTPSQIATMRSSRLARQFGGKTIGDMFVPEILRNLRKM
jgi:hypothetical protein